MAEWLGRGLQNLVQRFESASDLSFYYLILNRDGSNPFKKKKQKKQSSR